MLMLTIFVRAIFQSGKSFSVCSNPNEPPSLAWSGMRGEEERVTEIFRFDYVTQDSVKKNVNLLTPPEKPNNH
jgi:hypothetical protein